MTPTPPRHYRLIIDDAVFLHETGSSIEEILPRIGVSEDVLNIAFRRLGVTMPKWRRYLP